MAIPVTSITIQHCNECNIQEPMLSVYRLEGPLNVGYRWPILYLSVNLHIGGYVTQMLASIHAQDDRFAAAIVFAQPHLT